MKKLLSVLLVLLLLAGFAACGKAETNTNANAEIVNAETNIAADGTVIIGKGSKEMSFVAEAVDGTEKKILVKTDKSTVGEALVEVGLIAGEEGAYGLFVDTVYGTTLDYNKDHKYWALYVDGELSPIGVDQVTVEEGKVYAFRVEKG